MPKGLLYLTVFLLSLSSFCQKDSLALNYDKTKIVQKEISAQDIEVYKNDPNFNYEVVQNDAPEWWIAFKNWAGNLLIRFFEWLFGVNKASGALNLFLEFLPYVLLAVLLFILVKFFLNVNARAISYAKKNQATMAMSEEEHIIKNENIQKLIQEALANDNYRLAVRYYYLFILQIMTEKELIDWQIQKTNEDYLKELKQERLQHPFKDITRLYDYIWYGEFPMDHEKYQKAESSFSTLKQLLSNG